MTLLMFEKQLWLFSLMYIKPGSIQGRNQISSKYELLKTIYLSQNAFPYIWYKPFETSPKSQDQ